MIFDPEIYCTAAETRELDGKDAVTLAGAGLWAGVLSRGECLLEGLARPGQSGDILLGPSPLALTPQTDCHLVAVRLTGLCADAYLLSMGTPCWADGAACPGAAELIAQLHGGGSAPLAYGLLCALGKADETARPLPPLVAEAVAAIRQNYMALYGVEELSEQLGVTKSHLVRTFKQEMTERMKVTTCLNPLHTAMSVYGCMLGYTLICDEMKDADIVALIKRLGYVEGLPVVVNPGILEPKAFIDEVVEQRLPNPFMPDAPQRIATDTSQKVGIRFGETIKSYIAEGRDLNTLVSIPLALAGWLRYLLAVDDNGNAFEVSADPLKDDLQAKLAGIEVGKPETFTNQLDDILSNASIFGTDLTKTVLADKIKAYFKAELAGPGAVRKTLHDAVNA